MMALDALVSAGEVIGLVVEVMDEPSDAISDVNVGLDKFSSMACGARVVEDNESAKSSLGEVFEMSLAFRLYPAACNEESPDAPFGVLCLSGILLLIVLCKR